MASKTYQEILKNIRSREYQPVYAFHGEESFFQDQLLEMLEKEVLAEHEKAFNFTVLYGKDCQLPQLIDALRRFPMMAEKQLVILKEAQQFRQLKELQAYIENPVPSTVFCISHKHKKIDARTGFGKALKKSDAVALFLSKPLYDNELPKWIEDFVNGHGYQLKPEVSGMIAENIGNNLTLISQELEKLFFNVSKDEVITKDHVSKYIGISKTYNVFELTDAFANKDTDRIFLIYNNFASNIKNAPLVVVISALFQFFYKTYCLKKEKATSEMEAAKMIGLNPKNPRSADFLLKRFKAGAKHYSISQLEGIFDLLHQFDLKSKGVDVGKQSEEQLMLELFNRILMQKA